MADIQLGGSVGTTGVSILGYATIDFTTDANHTLSVSEYTNQFLNLTSSVTLTGQHDLIAPLVNGQTFIVQNSTTGGQSIRVIGSSGSGVLIPFGATIAIVCDGTRFSITSGASSSQAGIAIFQPGGMAAGTTFTDFGLLCFYLAYTIGVSNNPIWTIYFDGSNAGGVVNIPIGNYPIPSDAVFRGLFTTGFPQLVLGNGATGDVQFTGIEGGVVTSIDAENFNGIINNNTSTACVDANAHFNFRFHNCSSITSPNNIPIVAGTGSAITGQVSGNTTLTGGTIVTLDASSTSVIDLYDTVSFGGTPGSVVITPGGTCTINVAGPGVFVDHILYIASGFTVSNMFSPSTFLTFEPGTDSLAAFTDFKQLTVYMSSFSSPIKRWTVECIAATNFGTILIAAGTYVLPDSLTLTGSQGPTLNFADGTTFSGVFNLELKELTLTTNNSASPVWTPPSDATLILRSATISNAAASYFLQITSGIFFQMECFGRNFLSANVATVDITAGNFVDVALFDQSTVAEAAFNTPVPIANYLELDNHSSSNFIDPSYYAPVGGSNSIVYFYFSPNPVLVFHPGGANNINTFTDFSQLCGYITSVNFYNFGPKVDGWTIQMASGPSSPVIPTGTYVLPPNVTFTTTSGTNAGGLTLNDVVFDPPPVLFTIDNLVVICTNTVNPCVTVASSTGPMYLFIRGEFSQINCAGSQPFISNTDTSLSVAMKDQAFLTGGTPVIHFGATAEGFFKMYDQSKIAFLSSLDLTAGATVTIVADSGVTLSSPAPVGITITFADQAFQMTYTPTTLADWSGTSPTSIGDALDRIAAKITPIP